MDMLRPHSKSAVIRAEKEAKKISHSWKRRAHIRFSHVGEIAAYPDFSNALAKQIKELSHGDVDCVVYTRHKKASHLDPSLWIINFTLDRSCPERVNWVPPNARIVFSAFGGILSESAKVNFLEHHSRNHLMPIGNGIICPATHPATKIRSCDAQRCNLCFSPVENIKENEN